MNMDIRSFAYVLLKYTAIHSSRRSAISALGEITAGTYSPKQLLKFNCKTCVVFGFSNCRFYVKLVLTIQKKYLSSSKCKCA